MLPEAKLVIHRNDKILQIVTREVDTMNFVKSIESFQELANACLTQMIEDHGGSGDCLLQDDEDESDPDEDACTIPKKIKK